MSNETVIQVENLVKIYRLGKVSIPALRGISFDVTKGEFLIVMGPPGFEPRITGLEGFHP